tara:strand:- start:1373 stop:1633 length:261 start_codon:yes stop_codon:yes gene_type:complete
MIKELKYLLYIIIIFFFTFFSLRFYFSDENHKKTFRIHSSLDKKIEKNESNLILLRNNTDNIIELAEQDQNKKTKKYRFWELLFNE